MTQTIEEIAEGLVSVARGFYGRGWLMGTSGNLSAVVEKEPLRLAITASGVDKGELRAEQVLLVDERVQLVKEPANKSSKPSDESLLHVRIVKERGAGAVLHTHSVWNTMFSDLYGGEGGVRIEGYEMLKGLAGVRTHEHSEWLPIVDNSQDMPSLADTISKTLSDHKSAHGFLIARHGLYTWGDTLAQAKRHVEIFEFLLETMGRTAILKSGKA
ncbi:MAG TPA: methylthioribulose 1-phosphate dehydratase [Pyrinomonadaceae bacterium]|nr:methylthioribulose 1-phosphate dehydratase [Pyrinomonadaceae bacterium]